VAASARSPGANRSEGKAAVTSSSITACVGASRLDLPSARSYAARQPKPSEKGSCAMAVEVTVANPAYWLGKPFDLAQLLRGAHERGGQSTIGDPTGIPPDPDRLLVIADPGFWSDLPNEVAEIIAIATFGDEASGAESLTRELERAGGAVAGSHERLTLTVDEAADALGISRAFAYKAVRRNEIPHVRIGRRILVPRAALGRLLNVTPPPQEHGDQ
jgi:excisionase family DNA binding protein